MKKITLLITILVSITGFSQALNQGFETPTTPFGLPLNWAHFESGVASELWFTDTSGPRTGTKSAVILGENIGVGASAKYYLATPLVTIPLNGQLRFWVKTSQQGDQGGVFKVKVASAALASNQTTEAAYTTTLQTYTESQLSTNSTSSSIVYEEQVINFPVATYPAGTQVYIAFVSEVTQTSPFQGDDFYLDDVLVVSRCLEPSSLGTGLISSTNAVLSWTNSNPISGAGNNTCNQWEIEIVPITQLLPNGFGMLVNTNPYTATTLTAAPFAPLQPLTQYKYYVRSICVFSKSLWAGPFLFTTTVAPLGCNGNYIDSGGINANYQTNENSIITISPTNAGDIVTVTFTSFDTEATFDGMYVYDGPSTASPQIASVNPRGSATGALSTLAGAYWGTALPGPFTATTPNGSLTFNFKSDGLVTRAGWIANITCAPRPSCSRPNDLIATPISTTSVSLTWTQPTNPNNSTASAWQYIYLPCTSAAPTATSTGWLPSSTNSVLINNLTPGTCYNFYVRADCTNNDYSAISVPASVSTPLCNSGCNYSFTMRDSIGDGWNGNTMSVIQGGITVATLTGPTAAQGTSPITVLVPLCPGPFQLFWNSGGAWALEVGVSITSFLGIPLYNHAPGPGLQNSLLYSANARCIPPTCLQPSNLVASLITSNSVTLGWTNTGLATSWQVIALPCGSSAPTSMATGWLPASTNSLLISNLLSGCYDFYVRGVCSPTDSSDWSVIQGITLLPPSCINNTPAGNTCALAVPICNFNGYCGNTSAAYTIDSWSQLTSAFCGSIDNNSFLSFIASSSTISLNVWVTSSLRGFGIQMMVFSAANCGTGPVTSYTCWTPGVQPTGMTVVSATGLTPGNTYYLMIDGYSGDVCNYVIGAGSGIQTVQVDVTTPNANICVGQTANLTVSGGNNNYVWSPSVGLSASSGSSVTFTPTAAGTYTFTATSSGGSSICPQPLNDSQVITVVENTIPTFTQIPNICQNSVAPILPTTSSNALGITGTWNSTIDTSTLGTSIFTFTPVAGQCAIPSTMQVTVSPSLVATFNYASPYCQNVSNPSPSFSGGGGAGTFTSTTGLSINAVTGTINLAASIPGTYTVTNTIAASGSCAQAVATAQVRITALPVATFTYNSATYCKTGANPILTFTSGGVAGVFSSSIGLAITSAGAIDLANSTPGNYIITNTIGASTGCGAVTATFAMTITSPPVPTFSYIGTPYCSSATNPFPTFMGGGVAGVFTSTTGLSVNALTGVINLVASNAGTYTVTNTIAASGSCAQAFATAQVTITALPVATFTYNSATYCKTGANPILTLTSGRVSGVFSSSPGLAITSDGAIDLASSALGRYVITNTIAASAGCGIVLATFAITITAPQVATFSYTASPYCSNTTNPLPTFTGGGVAGVFTSTTGLSINTLTGVIDLAASIAGIYTVTNTIAPVGGCAAVIATTQVTITRAPQATISYSDAFYCYNNSGSQAVILTGTSGGTYSATPSGLTISTISGVINANSSQAGSYTITYTIAASGGCSQFSTNTTVSIIPEVTVELSAVCDGPDFTITALPVAESFNPLTAIYEWTGPSGFNFGPSSNPSVIVVTPGIYVSSVTFNGCTHVNSQLINSTTCSIQKGISPNGDGDNEAFMLADVKAISIFNRYGIKVYSHGANYTNEWHGQSSSGSELPDGTYYYIITRSSGESITGWIYINR